MFVAIEGMTKIHVGDNFLIHRNPIVELVLPPILVEFSLFNNMVEEERNTEVEEETTLGSPFLNWNQM